MPANLYNGVPFCNGHVSGIHKELPIFRGHDVTLWRCVSWSDVFYGKTVSTLHAGNLRFADDNNRYGVLFPGRKVSYWSADRECAEREIKKHGSSSDMLIFEAYDDASAFIPSLCDIRDVGTKQLQLIDGYTQWFKFREILDELDATGSLTSSKRQLVESVISYRDADGLIYESKVHSMSQNVLLFEHGFAKLALKSVTLRLSGRKKRIECSHSSDYNADCEAYGKMFQPVLRVDFDKQYAQCDEFLARQQQFDDNFDIRYRHGK